MKSLETQSNGSRDQARQGVQFAPVRDGRNRRIPGLYLRGKRYYGQLWVKRPDGTETARRFPLLTPDGKPASTVAEAKAAFDLRRHERVTNNLPPGGHKPGFHSFAESYLAKPVTLQKKTGTLENERQALARWKRHLGDLRIDRITTPMVVAYCDKRLAAGAGPRTVNLDLIVLRNALKSAIEDGILRELPKIKSLKTSKPDKRRLLTPEEFKKLLENIPLACPKNAIQFGDYIRFLAWSGAREQEALAIKWENVNFKSGVVTIGSDGSSKNREARHVDMNEKLEELLRDMSTRRAPDTQWIFPSPQRGSKDLPAKTFRESLKLARDKANLPWVGFHDFRHHFCSFAVMAGVDFLTIAGWLGHKDGGILIGKVYGHLLDQHRKNAAKKLTFQV